MRRKFKKDKKSKSLKSFKKSQNFLSNHEEYHEAFLIGIEKIEKDLMKVEKWRKIKKLYRTFTESFYCNFQARRNFLNCELNQRWTSLKKALKASKASKHA